jgi:hypothetical protein
VECGVKKAEHLFITDKPLSIFTNTESICFDHDKFTIQGPLALLWLMWGRGDEEVSE